MPSLDDLVRALRETGSEGLDELKRGYGQGARHAWDTTTNLAGRGLAAAAGAPVDLVHAASNLARAGYGMGKYAITGKADDLTPLDESEQTGGSEWMGRQLARAGLMTGERSPVLEMASQLASPLAPAAGVKAIELAEKGTQAAGSAARTAALATALAAREATPEIAGITRMDRPAAASVSRTPRPKPQLEPTPETPAETPAGGTLRDDLNSAIEDVNAKQSVPKADPTAPGGPLANFGTGKQQREARLKRLAEKRSNQEVQTQTGAGDRAKVDPDVYRQAWNQLNEATGDPTLATEAIEQAAEADTHLKPTPGGGYVGAPGWVLHRRDLRDMRGSLDEQVDRAYGAINYADPLRTGNWYDRAKAAQAEIHEPDQLDRGLEGTAVYSAGVSPQSELGFKVRDWMGRQLGTNEMAYRGAGQRTLADAIRKDDKGNLAFKIGEYRGKNDPRQVEVNPFGVNDFRMSQTFGYLDPEGNPWHAGASDTMHPFMDAENALALKRLNDRALGGKSDWRGAQFQEMPWVLGKAEDLFNRGSGPTGRFSKDAQGMVAALREANNTIGDYLPERTLSMTNESAPGKGLGHVEQILDASPEELAAYGKQGDWQTPTPYRQDLPHWDSPYGRPGPEVGAGDRNAILRAAGALQRPGIEAVGEFEGRNDPMTITRMLVDSANPKKVPDAQTLQINTPTRNAAIAMSRFQGLMDAQKAAAANMPVTSAGRGGQTSLLLAHDRMPSGDELGAMSKILQDPAVSEHVLGVTPTDRGALVLGTDKSADSLAALASQLEAAYPGSKAQTAAREGYYLPDVTTPPEAAGKGIATRKALQAMAKAPPQLARNISESDEVRNLIGQKITRDEALGGARPDIQKTREFFRDKDWAKVVSLMRQGMKPAAAMATVGASFAGMAAEPEAQSAR